MEQLVIAGSIVAVAACHAAWRMLPARLRARVAARFAKLAVGAGFPRALALRWQARAGRACGACDDCGGCAPPSPAREQASPAQPIAWRAPRS
jgi:hypothetical protein